MIIKNYLFKTPTVTIVEPNRYNTLYSGSVENIPDNLLNYKIFKITINKIIGNTYMETYI